MVSPVHAQVFRIAEYECPRLFGKVKGNHKSDKLSTPEEIAESRTKFMRDINKVNEHISSISGRDPDSNLNKSWGDWLATAQTTLDIAEEKRRNQSKGRKR